MKIGTRFAGEVDAVGPQCIKTKFFVLGLPLVPLESMFFTGPSSAIPIPLHAKSVFSGYLRYGLGSVVVIASVVGFAAPHYRRVSAVLAGVLLLGLIASLLLGRLSKAEKERRTVLQSRTGLAADPAILPLEVRHRLESDLRARLEANDLPLRPEVWVSRAEASSGAGPYREVEARALDAATWADAYAYARYAAVHDHEWRKAIEPLWKSLRARPSLPARW